MSRGRHGGTSLIEMLIAMVILAVLAGAAMPSWQRHVISARRNEAQAMLLRLMLQQERYFTQNGTYLAFSSGSSGFEERQFQWWSGSRPPTSAYEIEGKACDNEPIEQCVQLVATAGTAQVDPNFRDDECREMKLLSTGERLSTGTSANCWR
ncbi:MAG TPA: type IV pilin protein [Duganella sp.]|nr:type IV pilin protein [Duganella sp.]